MGRLLMIAVRNLLVNKRRNLVLGMAMVAVTLLLTLMASLGNGIQNTIIEAGTSMISGHVNVGGFYKITSGRPAPVLVKRAQLIADVKDLVPEATLVVDRRRGFGKLVSESDSIQAGMTGLDITRDRSVLNVISVVEGDVEDLARPRSVMLFKDQADRLGVKVGDELTVTAPVLRGVNNSLDVTLVAVADDLGLLSIMSCYVSMDLLAELYLLDPDTTGVIQLFLNDRSKAPEVEERLRNALPERGYRLMDKADGAFYMKFQTAAAEDWTGQKLDLTTWKDELSMLEWTVKTFDTVTMLLTSILLVIIIVGVMNTLWISIRDRTREIGTLRAIGMGRGRVMVMVLLEVAVLSLVATTLGSSLGVLVSSGLNAAEIPVSQGFQIFLMSDTLRLAPNLASVAKTIIFIPTVITALALIPAMRAARMKPITAIHHIG